MKHNNIVTSVSDKQDHLAPSPSEKECSNLLQSASGLNREELAEYLSEMINELRLIAIDAPFPFLAYLLDVAKDEALSELDKARIGK